MKYSEIAARLNEEAKGRYDATVKVSDLQFKSNGEFKLSFKGKDFRLDRTGLKTFCQRVGLPYEYFSRNPLKDTDRHANYWLEHCKHRELFIRVQGDVVRGVLHPSFEPYDNLDFINDISEQVEKPEILNFYESDYKLDVRLSLGDEYNYGEGDMYKLRLAMVAMNSELDDAPIQINMGLSRLKCFNDVIMRNAASKAFYRKSHRKIARDQISIGIMNALRVVRDQGSASANAFINMRKKSLTNEEREAIYLDLEDKRVFQKTFISTVRKSHLEEPTLFGVANQLTAAAKDLSFVQRRSVEEFVGCKLLSYTLN